MQQAWYHLVSSHLSQRRSTTYSLDLGVICLACCGDGQIACNAGLGHGKRRSVIVFSRLITLMWNALANYAGRVTHRQIVGSLVSAACKTDSLIHLLPFAAYSNRHTATNGELLPSEPQRSVYASWVQLCFVAATDLEAIQLFRSCTLCCHSGSFDSLSASHRCTDSGHSSRSSWGYSNL